MCGIAGFAGAGEPRDLARMTDALRHRGPDADGLWHDAAAGVFLGHRRLSIVDLAGGAQPMWTADRKLGIVFNGEIYNHAELRTQLQQAGHVFESDHSDTETLLYAYREWGEGLCPKLSGMWAFVIYDVERKLLFGSRDRFGKKPFYFHRDGEGFRFSSELTSLAANPLVPRNLSVLALQKYFAHGSIPGPRCIYENVWKLEPGSWFRYDLATGDFERRTFWEFRIEPEKSECTETDEARWAGEVLELLDAAVRKRLMSDVPLGVFLSGGIDSSAVAALAARHLSSGALNTFCIGFEQPDFDESGHARAAAQEIGTSHHEEKLDIERSRGLLPEIVARLDEPMGDSSLLPTYLLCRFARKSVTVALGGDGGDELFAGYDPFKALRAASAYAKLVPAPVHEGIRMLASRLPVSHRNISTDFKIKRTLRGLSYPPRMWNPVWMGPLEAPEIGELFRCKIDPEELYSEAIEAWERDGAGMHPVDRTLQFFTRLYLRDGILVKADRASMMNSLEVRSPFLDAELVERVRRIPWQAKLKGGVTKHILKKALEPVLPASILHRKKKGFGVPVGRWFAEGYFEIPRGGGVAGMDRAVAGAKWQAHRKGIRDERLFLWNDWLFGQWLDASKKAINVPS